MYEWKDAVVPRFLYRKLHNGGGQERRNSDQQQTV